MSDGRFADPHGPAHTVTGDQYNVYLDPTLLADGGGKTPTAVAAEQLVRLRRRFVHPRDFGRAREVLEDSGSLLLDGERGSGRRAAALVLLHELGGNQAFHELFPDEKKANRLDQGQIGDGARLLLDLSAEDDRLWHDVRDQLLSFLGTVRTRKARLVVVLPDRRAVQPNTDLACYVVRIGRPSAQDVLQRHLRLHDIDPGSKTRGSVPELDRYLDRDPPMRSLAALADLVARAKDEGLSGDRFPDWCKPAIAALGDRRREINKLVAENRTGSQRALLLTTAMLHKAHAHDLQRVHELLLHAVSHPSDVRPVLEREDLAERFGGLGAQIGEAGRVHFEELDYDKAVRAHFWDHVPEVRGKLCAWVRETVAVARLPEPEREALVRRFAEECLRIDHPEELMTVAEQWSGPARDRTSQVRSAAQALRHGLEHERHGRHFRRAIYDHSRNPEPAEGLTRVLVPVCAQVMAVRHPDEAMVRLHHLARWERRHQSAREELLRLVRSERRLRRRMLERLGRYRHEDGRSARRDRVVDADLFLELAAPDTLSGFWNEARTGPDGGTFPDRLAAGWSIVFRLRSPAEWGEFVSAWLLAAAAEEPHGDLLLDVLIDGSDLRPEILGQLYALARQAKHLPDHVDLGTRVLHKISAAQGVPLTHVAR